MLYKAVARNLNGASEHPAPYEAIEGLEQLDKVIDIDQSPIGRTPRSNPATYTGAFTPMREWFAYAWRPRRAAIRPGASRSTSRAGAARPAFRATSVIKIEMHFRLDVYVTCDVCEAPALGS